MKKITIINLLFLSTICFAQINFLDKSFGNNGVVQINNASIKAVKIQKDGRIIVTGSIPFGIGSSKILVARFKIDGTIDSTFGTGGKVITDYENYTARATSVVLQNDDKIIIAGDISLTGSSHIIVIRYLPNGALDSTFGVNGKVLTSIGQFDEANAVAVQDDGDIIIAGSTVDSTLGPPDFAVVRYNSKGELDESFGNRGIVTTAFGNNDYNVAYSIVINNEEKIVVGGYSSVSNSDFALARYNSDGSPDNTFGENGKVITDLRGDNDQAFSMILLKDGKIVLGGYSDNGINSDFALAKYKINGSLDSTFGIGGMVFTPMVDEIDRINSIKEQNNGRIVAVGYATNSNTSEDFAISRYLSTGVLDNTFGIDGKIITPLDSSFDVAESVEIQSDGKIIVGGRTLFNGLIVRYQNQSPDAVEDNKSSSQKEEYYLFNNYPNPFNPSTTIKYSIPYTSLVTLKVYDMLGREISTLVNEEKNEGNYEINFNASNLSSGVYFYKMVAGGFVSSKKFLLLK